MKFSLPSFFKRTPTAPALPNAGETAWSNSLLYSSMDFPKYNPDDLLTRKGYAIYGKMMNDEQVKAVVRFKRDAITSRDWSFVLDTDAINEEDVAFRKALFAAFIDLMPMSFCDALNGILSSMYNGFSVTEKVLGHVQFDSRTWVGIEGLRLKPADTFCFHVDQYGRIEKVVQYMDAQEQEIELARFIHFVQNPDVDEHYGRSELREAYRAWFSKDMAIKFQNIHLERFAAGFAWAAPKDGKTIVANSQEYTTLQNVMKNLQATSSIILPSGIELNIEHPATTDAFERAVAQHDKAIAKALLVPNLMGISEQGQTGSYSQSQTQLEAFLWTLEADATRLEEALNNQLFRELGDLNFGDGIYPQFKFKPVSDTRKLEIVKIWTQLVTAGAVQATEADEAAIRASLEMPKKIKTSEGAPDLVLNGAQVTSLIGIVTSVSKGELTPEAAKALVVAVYPISDEQAAAIIDGAVKPEPAPQPQQPVKPIAPKAGDPAPSAEPQQQPAQQQEETILGKMGIEVSAFTRAMKRVDFAVIANSAEDATRETVYDIASINSEIVARLLQQARELKLGTAEGNPDDLRLLKYTPAEMAALKNAAHDGLKSAWAIGQKHAKQEMSKAKGGMFSPEQGASFAVNDLALQDVAASYLKSKSYTLAGDISTATQKRITNLLAEGIKVSKTFDETHDAIYKALEADGLLTEEAVEEALGTTTVRATDARIHTAIRTSSFEAINEARYQYFSDPELQGFVEALEYSAILDDRTTDICSKLNGEVFAVDDEVWATYRPPNHFNCRSLLVPVTQRDTWTKSEPPTVMPQKGFGFCCEGGHK